MIVDSNSGFHSAIPSPRTMPCRDSGLLHDTRNFTGTSGNVFERPLAQEGRPSTLFNNSKNLASSPQELRPDIAGNTKRLESEMRREPQNSSIPVPRFQRGAGVNDHTGGIYSHSGMIDCPRWNCIRENFLTLWNFKAGKPTSRLKYVRNQQILISQCAASEKLRQQNNLTNL